MSRLRVPALAAALAATLLGGCPERVTWEAKPLDPRFTANAPGSGHQEVKHGDGSAKSDGGGPEHQDVEHNPNAQPPGPFEGVEGPTVKVSGVITAPGDDPIDIDLRAPDPDAPGGNRHLGKIMLAAPGPFEILAPSGFGSLTLEAFQDPGRNGPDDADPYATAQVVVGTADLTPLALSLEAGGRAKAAGQGNAGGSSADVFKGWEGEWLVLRGMITSPMEGSVAIDVRVNDPKSTTGDAYLGKIQLNGLGEYAVRMPRGYGAVVLEAFQDLKGDGPSPDDPYARAQVTLTEAAELVQDFGLTPGGRANVGGGGTASGSPTPAPPAGGGSLFKSLGEDPVTLAGELRLVGVQAAVIDLDAFTQDPQAPGGRRYLGKLKLPPGKFSLQAPQNAGALIFEAFVDLDNDGPTPTDPFGVCTPTPARVSDDDLLNLQCVVSPRAPSTPN